MISISMCMIVKNEQDILARCLDSYAGTYDELIIVDTGSTDNTKEIAAHYTDKIYDFEWINDFSAARNFAFSKAGCDYIFSADADEVLDDNAGGSPSGKPLELTGAFSPWGRRCPRPRPRTDEGRACGCCPLKERLRKLRPHQPPAGGSFSLRAKSRLRRLRSDTRLRAQPLGESL